MNSKTVNANKIVASFDFIENDNVILFWPCKNNLKTSINHPAYLDSKHNFNFRLNNDTASYPLISSGIEIKQNIQGIISSTFQGVVNGNTLKLNVNNSDKLPVYLTIDDENVYTSNILDKDKIKVNSLELKNILYNTTGSTPFTTLVHWGYITNG